MNRPRETLRPWLVPGAPTWHELRWRLRIARAPVLDGESYAASLAIEDREEVIGCDLCGEQRVQPLLNPGRNGRWSYHVVRCPSCGFLYRNPGIRPERLAELYGDGDYGSFLGGAYARRRRRRYRMVLRAFAPLFDEGGGRRLLDVGCGTGLFLELAHRRGFDCHGVDLAPDAVERAQGRPGGAKVYLGAPADVPEVASGGFDVITLWSVLAHLPRPVDELAALRALLAPGGALLILTVNANSLALKAHGSHWNGFTPNHLKFFAPSTLDMLLRCAGLERAVMPPMYGDAVELGTAPLPPLAERRLRRVVDRGNRGNMLRAVAYAPRR